MPAFARRASALKRSRSAFAAEGLAVRELHRRVGKRVRDGALARRKLAEDPEHAKPLPVDDLAEAVLPDDLAPHLVGARLKRELGERAVEISLALDPLGNRAVHQHRREREAGALAVA